ncbi:MAG: orotate phosphoribosyltransferase [Chloroflexi bacterium]|nr:orotate phosphoribosyltransferase [Chloroflexota bacterium]
MADSDYAVLVARALMEIGAMGFTPNNPVTFKSGLRAPVYVDNRQLISHPDQWHVVIGAFIVHVAEHEVDMLAGVETAGIPHCSALAYAMNKPSVFVRKQEKDHGLGRRIEGGEVSGQRVLLIEDMVTTGASSLNAIQLLRAAGATVNHCLSIITYGFPETYLRFEEVGISLLTLTTFPIMLDEALASGMVDEAGADVVREWLVDPVRWSEKHP